MAITHPATIRNGLANNVVDQVDTGTATATTVGNLIITTGGGTPTTLVSIPLQNPAFGAASGGTATMNGSPSGTATATGTAAEFKIRDRDDSTMFTGAVATTGSDLNLSNTNIASGDKIQITSFTYSAPN